MQLPVYIFAILIQLLLVVSIVAGYFFWKNLKLSKLSTDKPDLDSHKYRMLYLQNEIIRVKKKQEQLDKSKTDNGDINAGLMQYQKILEACMKAEKSSTGNQVLFWDSLIPIISSMNKTSVSVQSGDELIDLLKQKVKTNEDRVKNLEKFKSLFFDLQRTLSKTQEMNSRLKDELEAAVPTEDRSEELVTLLAEAVQEKETLKSQLSQVEHEFETLMKNFEVVMSTDEETGSSGENLADVDVSATNVTKHVGKIKDVVKIQQARIDELNTIIGSLNLEVDQLKQLQDASDSLQAKNEEMNDIIEILEEENTFMQDQIQALLQQEMENDKINATIISELSEVILTKEQTFTELQEKYADMEKEYLVIYEQIHEKK